MMGAGLEIERKYLIRMPDVSALRAMPGCKEWDILQIYLHDGEDKSTRRIRRIREDGLERYIFTHKRRINALSCVETENEITAEDFARLMGEANPECRPIEKRRLRIPYRGQLLEVDIYAFWKDSATLEIELESEDQAVELPEWIEIVRDVTAERAYKNRQMARRIPVEEIE